MASGRSAETDFIKQKQGEINRVELSHIGGNIFFYKNMRTFSHRHTLIFTKEQDFMLKFEENISAFPLYVNAYAPTSRKMGLLFVDFIGKNTKCDFKNLIKILSA